MIPKTVAGYHVEGPLGQSATGPAYKAARQADGQPVVLKVVPPGRLVSAAAREKFLQEARAATALDHPHLRRLYEVGEFEDKLFLAQEYVDGSTLRNMLVGGAIATETALEWGLEIAEGLAAAHAAGLIHGELVPGKVFIGRDGSIKLFDVGLWRLAVPTGIDLTNETNLNMVRLPVGTIASLAPEQLAGGEPDTRSDVFAFGLLLYEMVTGHHPFAEAQVADTVHCLLHRQPPHASDVVAGLSPSLDSLLARALAKNPEDRYPSAAEVAEALQKVAAGEELAPWEDPAVAASLERAAGRAARRYWWAIGAAVLILVLWFLYLSVFRP